MAESGDGRREVGDDAVWSLSSAKPGNGVDQLRDSTC
jgi:anaphase-promoting complex subunit 10